jgi:hypothetical protein
MRFSFKDLVAGDLTVKTDCNSDAQFKSYDIFISPLVKLNAHVVVYCG